MYNAFTNEWNLSSPVLWVDFGLSLLVAIFLLLILINANKRRSFTIAGVITVIVCFASWFFGLTALWQIVLMVMTAYLTVTVIQNQNEVRDFVFTLLKRRTSKGLSKVYDRHSVCQKVALAVDTLSKTKTGALITFEKGTTLGEVVKTGTILNAPVTPELLTTIFYPGTRLHDGAIVIRRDEILAASVYYTPTTKPLTGKFGSRHRAAIGISELTDSVTVVVSEETGRISIAYGGELVPVAADNFLRTLEEYVFSEDKTNVEEDD